ncbi:hypothetical protein [Halochromatium roseum]|uniref:hypothetical protein n=1 Tax=Halochromatium roseum TaxID=391920 RepID=UPI001913EF4F|nr:hypothetical protein [Halochromatium roseum]MBK5941416.1 hypothetical protein [Halochromatium roseum]
MPRRTAKIDVPRLRQRIKDHLLSWGDSEWERFDRPHSISHSMWRRYVREERDKLIEKGILERSTGDLLKTYADKTRVKTVAKAVDAKAITKPDVAQPIELMAEINNMLRYCDALTDHAAAVDGDTITVNDPADLREALKTRAAILKLAVDGQERYFSVSRVTRFHRILLARITEADPVTAKRILAEMNAIDAEYGLTLG